MFWKSLHICLFFYETYEIFLTACTMYEQSMDNILYSFCRLSCGVQGTSIWTKWRIWAHGDGQYRLTTHIFSLSTRYMYRDWKQGVVKDQKLKSPIKYMYLNAVVLQGPGVGVRPNTHPNALRKRKMIGVEFFSNCWSWGMKFFITTPLFESKY